MSTRVLIAIVLGAFLTSAALAQTPVPNAPLSVSSVPKTRDGKPKAKELRAACRAEASAKGLAGKERNDAAIACLRAGRPDLARRFDCRKEARAKGLSGKELSAAVQLCVRG